jgi:2',3'-cyclic-nucleotide 2'-phosphodiesterase (5'-nucleotidase family)
MDESSYTKGIYTARVAVKPGDDGNFVGVVTLERDDGAELEDTVYEVPIATPTEVEALEEAKALAHRILGELEL